MPQMEIRRSLTDRDEELASLRLTLFQHVKENGQLKKTLEQYNSERSDLRNVNIYLFNHSMSYFLLLANRLERLFHI